MDLTKEKIRSHGISMKLITDRNTDNESDSADEVVLYDNEDRGDTGLDIDDVYRQIGECGRYQIALIFLLIPINWLLPIQMVHNVFIAAEPDFYCHSENEGDYHSCPDTGVTCDSYVYNSSRFTSVVSEWDLVCGQAYKLQMIQSAFMLGVLTGSLTILPLSDKYGRLKLGYLAFPLVILLTFGGGMAMSYDMYIGLRFLAGVFTSAIGMVSFVLPTELFGPSKRSFIGMLVGALFAIGIGVFAVFAYYITDWRMLSVASAIVGVIAFAAFLVFPESPRWLQSQGKNDKAEAILEKIAAFNKQSDSKKPISIKHIGKSSTTSSPNTLTLFTHPALRLNVLINICVWFSVGLGYYGLTMSAGNLGSNMYISVALSGLVELPASLIAYLLMNRIGRKKTLSAHLLVGGVSCVVILLLPKDYTGSVTSLALLGKMSVSAAFGVAYIFSAEILPTVIRNTGMGVFATAARIGGILAPLVIPLDSVYPSLQFAVFGCVSFLTGIMCLKLPETLNKPLPETMNDLNATSKPQDGSDIVYKELKEDVL